MIRTTFNRFLRTKLEEETQNSNTNVSDNAETRLEVEIRPNPRTLSLFPWRIRQTLTINEVSEFHPYRVACMEPLDDDGDDRRHHDHDRDKENEKIEVVMHDLDTDTYHKVIMWKLPHHEDDKMYEFWLREFVRRRQLKVGMVVGMYWDYRDNVVCFSVLEADE